MAWITGWNLILEYGVSSVAVAIGWSGYFNKLLQIAGIHLPHWATHAPGGPEGGLINLPAMIIVLLCTWMLVVGITGARDAMPADLSQQIERLRTMTDLPLCVGFGVSRPEHVRGLKDVADGVIVGSALVKKLEAAATDRSAALRDVQALVKELSSALA